MRPRRAVVPPNNTSRSRTLQTGAWRYRGSCCGRPRRSRPCRTPAFRHDGEPVAAGEMPPPTAGSASDPRNPMASGRMTPGSGLAPGVYVLQVAVTDNPPTGKPSAVTEPQDFEVEP